MPRGWRRSYRRRCPASRALHTAGGRTPPGWPAAPARSSCSSASRASRSRASAVLSRAIALSRFAGPNAAASRRARSARLNSVQATLLRVPACISRISISGPSASRSARRDLPRHRFFGDEQRITRYADRGGASLERLPPERSYRRVVIRTRSGPSGSIVPSTTRADLQRARDAVALDVGSRGTARHRWPKSPSARSPWTVRVSATRSGAPPPACSSRDVAARRRGSSGPRPSGRAGRVARGRAAGRELERGEPDCGGHGHAAAPNTAGRLHSGPARRAAPAAPDDRSVSTRRAAVCRMVRRVAVAPIGVPRISQKSAAVFGRSAGDFSIAAKIASSTSSGTDWPHDPHARHRLPCACLRHDRHRRSAR